MPRAYDKHPSQRTNADHNPLANLLQWQDATAQSAQAAGSAINNGISTGSQQAADASSNNIGAYFQQLWLSFQSMLNEFTGNIDTDVADFNTALKETALDASDAAQAWGTVFADMGFSAADITQVENFVSWLQNAAAGIYTTNISWATITGTNAQLLDSPNFSGAISIAGNGIWSWDDTVYYIPPGQTVTSPGSAKVTANASLQALTSDPSKGDQLPLGQPIVYAVQVLTHGLTGDTDAPLLQLIAIPWIGDTAQSTILIEEMNVPTGATTGWTNPPAGSVAGTLFGSYTPTTGSGITAVSMQVVVTDFATGGQVWFSAASEELTGGLINDLQDDFNASNAASAALWTAWSTDAAEIVGGNWSGGIADAEAAWATYQTATAGIESAEYVTLEELLSTVGINFGSGQMNAGNVTSSLSLESLESDFDTVLGWFGSPTGSTTTNELWAAVTTDIINPLNTIEAQASNVIVGAGTWLTDVFANIFPSGADPAGAQIAAGAVGGIGGATSMGTAAQSIMDYLTQAFTGHTATGNSFGQLANAASSTAATAGNAQSVAQSATMVQAQQATAKPGYMAIDSTMDAVFPLSHMLVAPTYLSVTQAQAVLGYICVPDNIAKLSVAFVGSYTGTISALYINVYSMNPTTGVLTRIVTGANIIGSVGNLSQWNYYDLVTAVAATVGDWFAVEMAITGSGTYSLMGVPSSSVPANGTVFPHSLGASRGIVPTHDAVGVGSFTNTASATSFAWSHTLGSSATGILIEFVAFTVSAPPTVSSVVVGSTAATLLASKTFATTRTAYVYQLLNPPTGAQTITVTFTAATIFAAGNSDSYIGVSSFGTAATNTGASSGTASVSVPSVTGQTAVAAIFDQSGALSAFNQTTRWNNGNSSENMYGVVGDAAGSSSVGFSATAAGAWAAIGVSLVGGALAPPTSIASPNYSSSVPWFGLGTSAVTAIPVFAPEPWNETTPGTYTYTLPSWFKPGVDFLDAILLSPGGGGGGGIGDPGGTGTNTTVTVDGTTITATAGAGAPAGNGTQTQNYGGSPGNQIYQGTTYYGGGTSAYSYGLVSAGSSPGGGGAGGGNDGAYAFGGAAGSWVKHTFNPTGTTVSITVGAPGAGSPFFGAENGAPGAVWLVARQA